MSTSRKNIFLFSNILIFLIIFLFTPHFSYAEVSVLPNCPYKFSTELKMGDSHEDVVVLQEILNSDKRTIVALSGAGSPGKETGNFGPATRTALKKFQALFIEYIGVADGKFNEKTRTVAQAICEGTLDSVPQVELTSEEVETTKISPRTATNTTPLKIAIAANARSITANTQLRVMINSSREIQTPDSGSIIVDGGRVIEIRKMSKTQYLGVIVASEGARQINIQIEADKISALDGLTNDDASNEITVNVTASSIVSTINNAAGTLTSSIENILNQISGVVPTSKNCNGIEVAIETVCTSTTGTTGNTTNTQTTSSGGSSGGGGGGGSGGGGQNSLSQMLNSLMSGMTKGAQQGQQGANGDQGGWDQSQNVDGNVADIEIPAEIDPMCRSGYGIDYGGSCPDVVHLTQKVKLAAMQACTIIKKKISSQSQYRTQACNRKVGGAPGSSHMSGMALDINVNNLSSTERESVFLIFKKNGFNNIGCYRKGSGNVHLDHRGGGPRRWGSDYTSATYNPSNCPIELIKVFGS